MNRSTLIVLAVTATFATQAQATPSDLRDLVGDRASGAEREMEDRGYEHFKTITAGNGKIGYWYNDRRDQCVAINVIDGEYRAITEQPENMCDDRSGSSSYSSHSSHSSYGRGDPEDVEGMRASSGERELEDMGYEYVKSQRGDDRIWSNWWNERYNKCITVVTMNGRYDSVNTDTPAFDCNRESDGDRLHGSSSHDRYDDDNEVTLYRDIRFSGTSLSLYRDESDLGDTRIGNDELSSIRIPRGCEVTVWEHENFRGRSVDLYDDESDMRDTRLGNDEASSIEVDCR